MKDKLDQIFTDILKIECPAEEISVQNTPTWDSLGHLNLIIALEEVFEIEISPDEISDLYKDYRTISEFIEEKIGRETDDS